MAVQLSSSLPTSSSNSQSFSLSQSSSFDLSSSSVVQQRPPTMPIAALLAPELPHWYYVDYIGTISTKGYPIYDPSSTQPITITYSFLTQVPNYYSSNASERTNFQPLNAVQRVGAISALQLWANVANIRFQEVSDSGNGGLIRFGTAVLQAGEAAHAYYPNTRVYGDGDWGGDVWLSNSDADNLTQTIGSYGFEVLIHEIGHALGLKHPGNYNAGGGGTDGPYLPSQTDSRQYTVMSYKSHPQISRIEPSTPLLYDIAAIQYLYGANLTYHTGNDTYRWDTYKYDTTTGTFSENDPFIEAIWDTGGIDTIDASNQTRRAVINLGAGSFSSIGPNGSGEDAVDNLAIAYGVTIENANGGSGNDEIYGNEVNNTLRGGAGNDTIRGASGADLLFGDAGNDTLYGGVGNDFLDGGSENDHLYGEDDNDYLYGNLGDDTLEGGSGNDSLYGVQGDDILKGDSGDDLLWGGSVSFPTNTGDDRLDGGTGADIMQGQDGNDTYIVDNVGDRVIEYDSNGNDTGGEDGIEASIDFNLQNAPNVEVLTLTGGAIRGIGNQLDNTIFGNGLNNWIEGGDGNDTLYGSTFTSLGDSDIDVISGGNGNDRLYGFAGIDNLRGDAGADILDGGDGNDDLQGGFGDDILRGGNGNDYLTGGDTLTYTYTGNDFLDGGTGADIMQGQDGDDTYIVDSSLDQVIEYDKSNNDTGGIDTIQASVSYTLPIYVENLLLTESAYSGTGNASNNRLTGNAFANRLDGGAGDDTLLGGAGDDWLIGGDGLDELDGGTGNDRMEGGTGSDSYHVDSAFDVVVEAFDSGNDNVTASISYRLPDYVEALILEGSAVYGYGNASNNILTGNAVDNYLAGLGGNDILDGGIGNDTLVGGIGDDSYFVDSLQDVVIEAAGEGIDRVYAAVNNWILGETVENLTLVDNATIGFGNNLNNDLVGNSTKDDILSGGLGNDTLNGRGGNDYLNGGDGDDVLDGGIGADILEGGTGDDIYIVDNPGDVIIDTPGTGIETVRSSVSWTLGAGLDNLTLIGTDAINGTGNTSNNIITGNSAANVLDGGIGNDILIGGAGDDTYIVDSINDIVREYLNEGIDTVRTSLTWTLGDNVENLVLLGTAAINGTGNALNNVITGNSAANILNGGTGNDTLIGGDGDDTYIVDSLGDSIIDTSGTGIETVQSSVSWTLGIGLDNLVLTGAAAINGTGNTLNNRIVGNSAANILDGGIGDDMLEGGLGDDIYIVDSVGDTIIDTSGTGLETVRSSVSWTLGTGLDYLTLTGTAAINGTGNALTNTIIGNSSNNSLNGSLGDDTLTGGEGADSFVFDTGTAFTSAIGVDRITDFLAGIDKIILDKSTFTALSSNPGGALNPNEFATINDGITGATLAAASIARIVFNQFNGDLFYNSNGSLSGLGSGGRFATLAGVTTLTANSFAIQA